MMMMMFGDYISITVPDLFFFVTSGDTADKFTSDSDQSKSPSLEVNEL